MKQRYLFILAMICIFLCGCGDAQEEVPETSLPLPAGAAEIGNSSYACITGESEQTQQLSEGETAIVKAFAHKIYNPNAEYVVTLTTTVTGTYSSEEDAAEIVDVTTSLSDAQNEGFTVSEHLVGDTATVVLYLNQISVCHFQYRLSFDGTLEFI